MFDPQTAGGFLAAVPADRAEDAVDSINALGHTASIIGTIIPGESEIRLLDVVAPETAASPSAT